jgi:hypothetical protein
MEMDSVCIIDSYNYGSSHEMFNASLLKISMSLFKDTSYFAHASSIQCMKHILAEYDSVYFKNIPVMKGKNKYFLIFKYILSCFINLFFMLQIDKNSIIIFAFNNAFSLIFINILNKIYHRKIIIFCHGELELLLDIQNHKLGLNAKFIKKNARKFFFNANNRIAKNIYFIVLGEKIISSLKDILPSNIMSRFYAIDHPYFFKSVVPPARSHKSFNLCLIGDMGKNKNIENLVTVTKEFAHEIDDENLSFYVIGRVLINSYGLLASSIKILNKSKSQLSRKDFDDYVQMMDAVLFFYDTNSYRLTASGAVFDAINHEVPIIAFRNNYFEYLFEKYCPFGILVDSIDDMVLVIRKLLSTQNKLDFDFTALKYNLSPDMVKEVFSDILKHIKYI